MDDDPDYPSQDALDELCKVHDHCLDGQSDMCQKCACHAQLVNGANQVTMSSLATPLLSVAACPYCEFGDRRTGK